ncbi:hypothetical protein ACP4OV_024067 [Aristida adscensionis]
MVNWVAVIKKQLVHRLAWWAGLRPHSVDVDEAGTVITIWVPKDKLPSAGEEGRMKKKEAAKRDDRVSVVLLHGFAGDGILTWVLQVVALAKHFDVYIPDLLFFGGSTSPAADRSPAFQAECVAAALRRLGVERCAAVGFSYGGFVAFRMAAAHPGMVRSVVATGTLVGMTASAGEGILRRVGAASFAEFLLPGDVAALRSLFAAGTHGNWWFPDRLLKDYLELLIFNRKERAELLDGITIADEDASAHFQQGYISAMGQLGEKATLRSISKAGHLVQLERPCVFNRCLTEFLLRGAAAGTYAAAAADDDDDEHARGI